jgi:tetratricopeptide (TPR) repeat protein
MLKELNADPKLSEQLANNPLTFELKAQAEYDIHQIDTAFETLKEGLTKFPQHARLFCLKASLHKNLGQFDSAEKDFKLAENSPNGDDARTALQVAMFYLHRKDWSAAMQRFSKLGAESIYSPFLDRYLICLHNLGRHLECFNLATKALSAKTEFDPTLRELAARCAYNANDLPSAKKHFEELVQRGSGKMVEHQKMLAQVYLRLDEADKALAVLKKAHALAPKDVDVSIGLSFAFSLKKQHAEAIKHAFSAVNVAGKNARAHMAFVKASLDCPLGLKIEEKYRKAFQRSLEFLNKHSSGFIKAIPVEEDLSSIIAMVKARAEHADHIQDLILNKNMPMAVLARQLGLSAFRAWMGLMAHPKLHVHLAFGTSDEQAKETDNAHRAKSICLDVFALLTLRLLNQLDLLPKIFPEIFIHTAVLETVVESIREMEMDKTGESISFHDGKLVRTEIGPEQAKERLNFLKDIRDFLKSEAVTLVGLDTSLASVSEAIATKRHRAGPGG